MADAKINTAGYLIMGAMSIWIESPVIDLLATSTTLAKSRASFLTIRRFAIWMIIWVTFAHVIASTTPLYDFLMRTVIGLDDRMVSIIRVPFILMIPWSGCIGWRRYLQGLIIRSGQTRAIGVGTLVRFGTMAGVGVGLYLLQGSIAISGLAITAIALVSSVATESIFIHWVSRETVRQLSHIAETDEVPLTMAKVVSFHIPLTFATMVMMLSTPAVGAALARTPDNVQSLASWQVGITLLGLLRSITFALNEVVITLFRDDQSKKKLFRFCFITGLSISGFALMCHFSGLDYWVFRYFLKAKPDIADLARTALLAACATPTINALMVYYRGLLTSQHETVSRLRAIFVGVITLIGSLFFGVWMGWPGVLVAAFSLTLAMSVELAILAWSWRVVSRRLSLDQIPVA